MTNVLRSDLFNSPRHPGLKYVGNYQVIFTNPHTHTYTDTPTKKNKQYCLKQEVIRQKKSMIKKKKKTHSALLVLHSTSEVHSEYPRQWVDLSNNPDGEQ